MTTGSCDLDPHTSSSSSLSPALPSLPNGSGSKNVRKNGPITANVSTTKYEIVRLVVEEMQYVKSLDKDETANLIWSDCAVQHEKIAELRNYQRINHFPGMGEISRKDCLSRNMTKMIKCQPHEYNFVPHTWIFPSEYTQFQTYMKELKKKKIQKTFIIKPSNGAMGHGISLIRNGEKLQSHNHLIVQEYLDKPFLLEGYKFDLRVYVLVTSCDPLKIFLYNDGLVRMGTEKYHQPSESNLSHMCMHLTNYSVNKHNENFGRDEKEGRGSKRSIHWLMKFLYASGYDVAKLWIDISDLVVKTLLVAEPHLVNAYRMCRPGQQPSSNSVCFEVLGFDIILDKKLKPWLLEINRAPSFGIDEKIDYTVKKGVLLNALKLLDIRSSDKRKHLAKQKAEARRRLYGQGPIKKTTPLTTETEKQRQVLEKRREELKERLSQIRQLITKEEYENKHMGNYRRIYPPDDKRLLEKYEDLLNSAFQTLLSGRATSLQREMNDPLKKMKEEELLDLLDQCELEEEKLTGKYTEFREPRALSMTQRSQSFKKQSFSNSSSCGSDCSSDLKDEKLPKDKKASEDLEEKKYQSLERYSRRHCKSSVQTRPFSYSSSPSSSTPKRRSVSCSRSMAALNTQLPPAEHRPSTRGSEQVSRLSSGNRTNSLNRSTPSHKVPHTVSCGSMYQKTESDLDLLSKDQEEELTRQTLLVLRDLRISFPGKVDEHESCSIIEEIMDNWKYHKSKVATYWLIKLDSTKQRKVLDIVRTNIRSVLLQIWNVPNIECLPLYKRFNRVFNRLLWTHGHGLWSCFCGSSISWDIIFSKSEEIATPDELLCCQRLVELCKDCLLVVYKYATDSQRSTSFMSQDGNDIRYLLTMAPQLSIKMASSNVDSSGLPQSSFMSTSKHNQC